ncbi:DNA ligase [Ignicoccus islandicus DSM 13165]|uniref:DNA ligase n=1 Tax=Ignicoccus islandicus DSM 13165 TaxID=940295 RepID=A0A0U3FNX7_9CREN|nr:DNA ligase [Ignicoccus islandicus DSM 13165]
MKYKHFVYLPLKRSGEVGKGGVIIYNKLDKESVILPGYPSIKRLVLLSKIRKHFPEGVSVEEKMNGYNVRAVKVGNDVVFVTRGGYLCPYTNSRLKLLYGDSIKEALSELPKGSFIAGEVVGTENPYVRVKYPEAPYFDYFIFDVFVKEDGKYKRMGTKDKYEFLERYSLKSVRLMGVFNAEEAPYKVKEIIDKFDEEGREGVVLKDPQYKRPPAKYTGSYTNIGDIELGMRYPFDEGRDYLFPRIVREMFKVFEEELDNESLKSRYEWLGKAILGPSVESIRKVANGEALYERFVLRFPERSDLEWYLEYTRELGINVKIEDEWIEDGLIVVRAKKFKDSTNVIRSMLETGQTPLD